MSNASSTSEPPKRSSRQRGPTGRQRRACGVVVGAGQGELQPVDRERLGQSLAPLHDRDGVLEVGVQVEVVELGGAAQAVGVDVDSGGPSPSEGCTREITKVGEVTSPRTPSPSPMPWVSVVLPAPRSPVRITRSPGRSTVASHSPNARVSSAVRSTRVIGSIFSMFSRLPLRPDSTYPSLRQNVDRLRQLHARLELEAAELARGRDLARPASPSCAATPSPRTVSSTPTRRSPSSRPRGSRSSAPDRLALVLDEQPAVGVERLAHRLEGLVERGGRWVERRPVAERLVDHRQHVGRSRAVDGQ